jgi:hypothetical protein
MVCCVHLQKKFRSSPFSLQAEIGAGPYLSNQQQASPARRRWAMNANQIRHDDGLKEPVSSAKHLTLVTPSTTGSSAESSGKDPLNSRPLPVILIALGFALYFAAIFWMYVLQVH